MEPYAVRRLRRFGIRRPLPYNSDKMMTRKRRPSSRSCNRWQYRHQGHSGQALEQVKETRSENVDRGVRKALFPALTALKSLLSIGPYGS